MAIAQQQELEAAAERAHDAFYAAAPDIYRPPQFLSYENLPDVLKSCWRAAAEAARLK